MNFEQYALATFVLIGFVNGIQFAVNRDWKAFVYFSTATVGGVVLGYLRWFGLPGMEMGLAIGVNSSGVYKGLQLLGGLKK